MPSFLATSAVSSRLASSTRTTSSTNSKGISLYVFSRVLDALYAGRTITIFLPFSIILLTFKPFLSQRHKGHGENLKTDNIFGLKKTVYAFLCASVPPCENG